MREDFISMALVFIQDPSWLDNGTWEKFLQDILIFTNMKFGEVQFPVQHFDEANGAMMQIFVDNIRRMV